MDPIDLGPIGDISLLIDGATLDDLLSGQRKAFQDSPLGKRYRFSHYEPHGDGIAIVYRAVEEGPAKEMIPLVVSRA